MLPKATLMDQSTALADSPVLVIGVHRSGTTLLSLMLDCHSRIAIPGESHFIVPYA
jgi:hypothetical protein